MTFVMSTTVLASCVQLLQVVQLQPDALCRLLPQAISLGIAAATLSTLLATQAAAAHEELIQEQEFLQHWQLSHVQHLLDVTYMPL